MADFLSDPCRRLRDKRRMTCRYDDQAMRYPWRRGRDKRGMTCRHDDEAMRNLPAKGATAHKADPATPTAGLTEPQWAMNERVTEN